MTRDHKPRSQAEIEDAYEKFEQGETLWGDFLRETIRHAPKTEQAEPAGLNMLKIDGPMN